MTQASESVATDFSFSFLYLFKILALKQDFLQMQYLYCGKQYPYVPQEIKKKQHKVTLEIYTRY